MQKIIASADCPQGQLVDLTPDEIVAKQAEWDAQAKIIAQTQYANDRRNAYPAISDQLDMLWHLLDQGLPFDKTSQFYNAIAAVKNQFPKPSE